MARAWQDGFDLDLSYITPRLVSMGFPSTGKEAIYRNPGQKYTRELIEATPRDDLDHIRELVSRRQKIREAAD